MDKGEPRSKAGVRLTGRWQGSGERQQRGEEGLQGSEPFREKPHAPLHLRDNWRWEGEGRRIPKGDAIPERGTWTLGGWVGSQERSLNS